MYKLGARPDVRASRYRVPRVRARAEEQVRAAQSKAFASLHKHVSGDFEPFVKDDRAQIAPSLLDHIRDLNFLDDRLHRFAARLFDERFEANEEKIRREVIPLKLPK